MSEELSFPSSDVSSPPTRPTVQTDSGLRPYAHKKQQFMTVWKWMIYNCGKWCADPPFLFGGGSANKTRLRMAPIVFCKYTYM